MVEGKLKINAGLHKCSQALKRAMQSPSNKRSATGLWITPVVQLAYYTAITHQFRWVEGSKITNAQCIKIRMQCQMLGPIYIPKTYPPPQKKKKVETKSFTPLDLVVWTSMVRDSLQKKNSLPTFLKEWLIGGLGF